MVVAFEWMNSYRSERIVVENRSLHSVMTNWRLKARFLAAAGRVVLRVDLLLGLARFLSLYYRKNCNVDYMGIFGPITTTTADIVN